MSNCCLKSEDNTTDILLQQVKREIKELSQSTTARLLIQDKKIAETCVYIKNNLSNEIRILLDTMENTGELAEIITETLLGEVAILQSQVEHEVLKNEVGVVNLQYPYGHIKRYGAKGDGVADDTKAIQTALDTGKDVVIPEGTYLITDSLLLNTDGQKIIGDSMNSVIKTDKDIPVLICNTEAMKMLQVSNITLYGGTYGFYKETEGTFERALFKNVNFEKQSKFGVCVEKNARMSVVYFEDCIFRYSTGGICLKGDNNNIFKVLTCRFEGLDDYSVYIKSENAKTTEPSGMDVVIADCRIEAHDKSKTNEYSPIYLDGCVGISIERNYVEDVKSPVIQINGNRYSSGRAMINRNIFYNSASLLPNENTILHLIGNINMVEFSYNNCSFGANPKITSDEAKKTKISIYSNNFLEEVVGFSETSFGYNDFGYADASRMPVVVETGTPLVLGTHNGFSNNIYNRENKIVFAPYENDRVVLGHSVNILTSGAGVVLRDAANQLWKVSVSTSGELQVAKVDDIS